MHAFPVLSPALDPSSDFLLTTAPSGCAVVRYDSANPAPPDGDAGIAVVTGYTVQSVVYALATGGHGSPPAQIVCEDAPGTSSYACAFAGTFVDGGVAGSAIADDVFPAMPFHILAQADAGPSTDGGHSDAGYLVVGTISPSSGGWPFGDTTCDPHLVPQGGSGTFLEMCEQHPFAQEGIAVATESVAGGADFGPATAQFGDGGGSFPSPVTLLSLHSGATEVSGTDALSGALNLDVPDGIVDPAAALTARFSCDGSPVPGSGCPPGELIVLRVTSSTSTKDAFGTSSATGDARCYRPLPDGTVTLSASQLQALLGGQTGGSLRLELIRLQFTVQQDGVHPLLLGAGQGLFGYSNQ